VLGAEDVQPSEILVYFNIQVTPFLESPIPHEYRGLHGLKLHLQSALGELQMLLDPDTVLEFLFETLKGTICLVRIFDNEGSFQLILELSNEFWEEIQWDQ